MTNVFGKDSYGHQAEVPWSRVGSCSILSNGIIDCTSGDYGIYRIAADGCTAEKIAHSEPYDYPDEASLSEAKWRYYINGKQAARDYYVQYLKDRGYVVDGKNASVKIDWVQTGN